MDGRRPGEARRCRAVMGALGAGHDGRVAGSGCFELGNTKALAIVYGPREVRTRAARRAARRMVSRCRALSPMSDGCVQLSGQWWRWAAV